MSGLCFHPWGEVWFPSAVSAFHCTGSLISKLCFAVWSSLLLLPTHWTTRKLPETSALKTTQIVSRTTSVSSQCSQTQREMLLKPATAPCSAAGSQIPAAFHTTSLMRLWLCLIPSNPQCCSVLTQDSHTRVCPRQHLHFGEEPAVSQVTHRTKEGLSLLRRDFQLSPHRQRPVSVGRWQAGRYSKVPFDKGVHKPLKLLVTDNCFPLVNGLNKNVCTEAKNAGSEARQHPAMVINTYYTNKLPEWLLPQMSWSYPMHKLLFDAACYPNLRLAAPLPQKTSFLLK